MAPKTKAKAEVVTTPTTTESITTFVILGLITYLPTRYLPLYLAPELYISCFYVYPADVRFDITWMTWATDYGLAVWMAFWIWRVNRWRVREIAGSDGARCRHHNQLVTQVCLMLSCYLVSVVCGGYGHSNYTTGAEVLNTTSFRVLWTFCVGSVALAGGFIGSIASLLQESLETTQSTAIVLPRSFKLPRKLWWLFGTIWLGVTAAGGLSMCRPACDIFLAGVTQFVPFTYLLLCGLGNYLLVDRGGEEGDATKYNKRQPGLRYRLLLVYGSLGNAPLLWLYPLLARTDLSLGVINFILHISLAMAWGSQGAALEEFVKCF